MSANGTRSSVSGNGTAAKRWHPGGAHRVLSLACVVATGVTAQGERAVLGCDVGPSEAEAFWTGVLTVDLL